MKRSLGRRLLTALAFAATLTAAGAVHAQQTSAPPAPPARRPAGLVVLGAEVGPYIPITPLGVHVGVGLEAGGRLPFIGRRIEIMGAVGYSPPQRSYTTMVDNFTVNVVQEELFFSLGPRVRVL